MGKELMHIPLWDLPVAAVDFESAGAAPGETDCPVQVGIVRVSPLFGAEECFCSYIAPRHRVQWSAAKVHGITTEMLTDAPPFTSLWPTLKRLLSDCVVLGHNPATEMRFLQAFPGHGFGPWLDTLALSRLAMPDLPDHTLSAVCEALGLTTEVQQLVPGRRWHDALFDAAASLTVLRSLVTALHMETATLNGLGRAVRLG